MKRPGLAVQIVVLLLLLVLESASAYQVGEAQQVVITQFGDPIGGPVETPGLQIHRPLDRDESVPPLRRSPPPRSRLHPPDRSRSGPLVTA